MITQESFFNSTIMDIMWQKFNLNRPKMSPFPLYQCCNKKIITVSTLEQHYYCINIDKGGKGIFSMFLTFCHSIMSMIVVSCLSYEIST